MLIEFAVAQFSAFLTMLSGLTHKSDIVRLLGQRGAILRSCSQPPGMVHDLQDMECCLACDLM